MAAPLSNSIRGSRSAATDDQQRRALQAIAQADLCVWRPIDLDFADAQAAALTLAVALRDLAPSDILRGVVVRHTERFAGTGITGVTLSVGVSGSPTKYTAAHTISAATGETVFQSTACFGIERMGGSTPTPLVATFTATGANLSLLAAGQVTVFLLIGHVD